MKEKAIDIKELPYWRECGCGRCGKYIHPIPGKLYQAKCILEGGRIKKLDVVMFVGVQQDLDPRMRSHIGVEYLLIHDGELVSFGGTMTKENFKRIL